MSDEKTCSDGELVAGIHKYFLACLAAGMKLPIGAVFGTNLNFQQYSIFMMFCNFIYIYFQLSGNR